jgi:hypothetical protein
MGGWIRINLREIGWSVEWIQMAQDRGRWWALVNAVMNLRVLKLVSPSRNSVKWFTPRFVKRVKTIVD